MGTVTALSKDSITDGDKTISVGDSVRLPDGSFGEVRWVRTHSHVNAALVYDPLVGIAVVGNGLVMVPFHAIDRIDAETISHTSDRAALTHVIKMAKDDPKRVESAFRAAGIRCRIDG